MPTLYVSLLILWAWAVAPGVWSSAMAAPQDANAQKWLDAALTRAEQTPDYRLSFTMAFSWKGGPAVTTRFDASSGAWTHVSGDLDAMPSEARAAMGRVQASEAKPGGLLYADFRPYLSGIEAMEVTGDKAVYSFIPPETKRLEAEDPPVEARLVVSKADARLAVYSVAALRPFKPNPFSKLEVFEVRQEFERLDGDGPAVLVRLVSRRQGSQVFRSVDVDFTATFSDFVPLEAE